MSSDSVSTQGYPGISKFTGPIVRSKPLRSALNHTYRLLFQLLGHLFNWALYGILSVQCYLYYVSFPKDRRLPKVLVWVTLLLETLQLVLSTRDAWMNLASGWGDMRALDNVGWQWFSLPILMVLRVAATYVGAVTAIHLRYSLIRETTYRPMIIWFVSTAVCDFVIAISTFYYLKKKKTYFRPTETMMTKLIRVTVETGLICAACALLELIMFVAFADDTFYMPMCLLLSKLYSNSLLAVLNSRMRIVGSRDETPAVYDSTLSPCPPSGEAIAIQPVRRATITIKGGKRTSQEEIVLACQEERTFSDSSTVLKSQDFV
ncbi:hypothetical protein NLI96_g6805 [Meripilus lineatus]|uniref:DUF6534 domain-containing protein n=1 Tax=Meripilus lineatus TaxID=2056292 RepID=A0AAD5V230_9APHY|nr:hypothetical protein NLI96_g6805 [Physisporinus lineatus]